MDLRGQIFANNTDKIKGHNINLKPIYVSITIGWIVPEGVEVPLRRRHVAMY